MTNNTIPNVPRELLERAWRALASSATGREIGAYLDADPCAPECAETCARASMCAACSADLSAPSPANHVEDVRAMVAAPSPAGVDGLNTDRNAAFKACPEAGCDWGSFYHGWKARGSVDQAIIDGLRGEIEVMTQHANNYSRMFEECAEERDQQAQRIGELEGLLMDVAGMFHGPGIEGGPLTKLRRRLNAALSAGKDSVS